MVPISSASTTLCKLSSLILLLQHLRFKPCLLHLTENKHNHHVSWYVPHFRLRKHANISFITSPIHQPYNITSLKKVLHNENFGIEISRTSVIVANFKRKIYPEPLFEPGNSTLRVGAISNSGTQINCWAK